MSAGNSIKWNLWFFFQYLLILCFSYNLLTYDFFLTCNPIRPPIMSVISDKFPKIILCFLCWSISLSHSHDILLAHLPVIELVLVCEQHMGRERRHRCAVNSFYCQTEGKAAKWGKKYQTGKSSARMSGSAIWRSWQRIMTVILVNWLQEVGRLTQLCSVQPCSVLGHRKLSCL